MDGPVAHGAPSGPPRDEIPAPEPRCGTRGFFGPFSDRLANFGDSARIQPGSMQTNDWLQLALTIGTMIIGGVVFYFKNLEVLRKEISSVREDIHRLDVTVARLEERMSHRLPPSSEAPAE